MKTVIYDMRNNEVIKVVDTLPKFSDLRDYEDFMPVSLWNEGCEFEPSKIIRLTE